MKRTATEKASEASESTKKHKKKQKAEQTLEQQKACQNDDKHKPPGVNSSGKKKKKNQVKGQGAANLSKEAKDSNNTDDDEEEKGGEKHKGEKRPCCFLDIAIGKEPAGRIVIELFRDALPKTCENFRALCTGEKSTENNRLHYKGSVMHKVTPNFVIQGGDFENGDGSGGRSIYGGPFEDEGFSFRHAKPGTVAMANKGKDGNTSQFYITLSKTPLRYLDNKHVVFGKVAVGMDVVRKIGGVGTEEGVPSLPVTITDCGRFKLKSEKKKVAELQKGQEQQGTDKEATTEAVKAKPTCPKCQGGLKYIKRIPKQNLARFWCKNQGCDTAVNLPYSAPAENPT